MLVKNLCVLVPVLICGLKKEEYKTTDEHR